MREKVRKIVVIILKACMIMLAFNMAVLLRHEFSLPATYINDMVVLLVPLLVIKLASFCIMRLLTGWWRYVSLYDLILLVKANLLGSSIFALYIQFSSQTPYRVSASLIVLDCLLCFLLMSGARVAVRMCREYYSSLRKSHEIDAKRILIVGAGSAGQSIVKEIYQNPHLNWKVIGYVDQDEKRVNKRFQGVPVLSTIAEMKSLLGKVSTDLVVMANPCLCHKELRSIVELCREFDVKSKILPNVDSILNGGVSIHHVRDVILDDLLGRPCVDLDVPSIKNYLSGKRVLVTGAAGSIGSEICRQITEFGADCTILLDNAETPLFNLDRELKIKFPNARYISRLCDVRDAKQIDYTFNQYRPEVVFHAAAYKHVPMSQDNPLMAIGNNVIGTMVVANAADRYQANHFVMVSTDKAVNPSNIMGASKRASEVYIQALASRSSTKIVTVRFGNVLGSNGSVVPIFQEQIRNGGPVTVTDPRVTRFFMTIPEAVQLVLQAGSMGNGGEIFVLDMGEQIKIIELAEELIRLSGLTPFQDIDIVFTGLRPGEKLHEELLHSSEGELGTSHDKIRVAQCRPHDLEKLRLLFTNLSTACRNQNVPQVMSSLQSIVPEYHQLEYKPAENHNNLYVRESKILRFPRYFVQSA